MRNLIGISPTFPPSTIGNPMDSFRKWEIGERGKGERGVEGVEGVGTQKILFLAYTTVVRNMSLNIHFPFPLSPFNI